LKPHLSVMKLRHTCLTLLLNEGVELVVLRDLAGHETVRTQKQLRQAVEKLPFGGKGVKRVKGASRAYLHLGRQVPGCLFCEILTQLEDYRKIARAVKLYGVVEA